MKTLKLFFAILLFAVLSEWMPRACMCSATAERQETLSELEKQYSPEELKEDLDFMFKTMEDVHPNLYAYTAKSVIDEKRKQLEEEITHPLTPKQFYGKVCSLVAPFKDGHTGVSFPDFMNTYRQEKHFPFDVRIKNKKVHIIFNYSGDDFIEPGSELLFVNGVSVAEIITGLIKNHNAERERYTESVYEHWGLSIKRGPDDGYEIEFILRSDGKRYTRKVKPITGTFLCEMREKNRPKKKDYSYHALSDGAIGIIEVRTCKGNLRLFKRFLKRTFARIKNDNISHLIIDIRENGGGDDVFPYALIGYLTDRTIVRRVDVKVSRQGREQMKRGVPQLFRWVPGRLIPGFGEIWGKPNGSVVSVEIKTKMPRNNPLRFRGDVHLLIGVRTFSAGCTIAFIIKDYKLGTLIGEETGGLATGYGNVYSFNLPNTRIECRVSSKYFVRPSGEADGRGILPDYEIEQDIDDAVAGIDTVMEFAKELILSNRNQSKNDN